MFNRTKYYECPRCGYADVVESNVNVVEDLEEREVGEAQP